jgi:hypothetical protein
VASEALARSEATGTRRAPTRTLTTGTGHSGFTWFKAEGERRETQVNPSHETGGGTACARGTSRRVHEVCLFLFVCLFVFQMCHSYDGKEVAAEPPLGHAGGQAPPHRAHRLAHGSPKRCAARRPRPAPVAAPRAGGRGPAPSPGRQGRAPGRVRRPVVDPRARNDLSGGGQGSEELGQRPQHVKEARRLEPLPQVRAHEAQQLPRRRHPLGHRHICSAAGPVPHRSLLYLAPLGHTGRGRLLVALARAWGIWGGNYARAQLF